MAAWLSFSKVPMRFCQCLCIPTAFGTYFLLPSCGGGATSWEGFVIGGQGDIGDWPQYPPPSSNTTTTTTNPWNYVEESKFVAKNVCNYFQENNCRLEYWNETFILIALATGPRDK